MTENNSYRLNGSDRFQLLFDTVARRNTGIGNVIRAQVTVKGRISGSSFRQAISANEAILFISGLELKKKWYSTQYIFVQKKNPVGIDKLISFHRDENPGPALEQALSRDCNPATGSPLHIDVIFDNEETHIIFSANHSLMDYTGMEILLGSVFEGRKVIPFREAKKPAKSFASYFIDTVVATFFVAARTAWNLRRLPVRSGKSGPAYEKLEFTLRETELINQIASNGIRTNSLSYYLGCSLFSLHQHSDWLTGKKKIYFIAVPLDRRQQADKYTVLSNFHSFIYFHSMTDDIKSIRDTAQTFSQQMIMQARRKMPDKFSALLNLFRYIPAPVYRAFIDLPTNGHAGTFAFSLLPDSRLEINLAGDYQVVDVTHYAPVIAPPGLNIVFHKFAGKLKIILSFDDSRMTKLQAKELLNTIRKNFLNIATN